jgi:hypothetical protein
MFLPRFIRAQTDKLHCSTKAGVNLRVGRNLLAEVRSRLSTCHVMLRKRARCCARELGPTRGLGAHVGAGFFRLETDL